MSSSNPKFAAFISSLSISEAITVLAVAVIAIPVVSIAQRLVRPYFSALNALPGPQSNFLFGNLKEMRSLDSGVWHEQMVEKYGPVLAYGDLLGNRKLFTVDQKALNHVLTNQFTYHRNLLFRWLFDAIFGHGLLGVEDMVHKRQRRLINPSFSTGHIREMTDIFVRKSQELRDHLQSEFDDSSVPKVDMMNYLTRTTLDIIGLAGFNYSFNALDNQTNELSDAFTAFLRYGKDLRFSPDLFFFQLIKGFIPFLRNVHADKKTQDLMRSLDRMNAISHEVVDEGKKNLGLDRKGNSTLEDVEKIGKNKDILSIILRGNATTLGDGVPGLSDKEFASQIPTFLFAGHETTANSTSMALISLACYPKIQKRLRNEILSLNVDSPTMDELNSLTYLDHVVREALRFHSIVPFLERVAVQDDIIPVDTPYKDRFGQTRDYIAISKGDSIHIPLMQINLSKDIWGEDAKEFNPDRWISPPKASNLIPGAWGNQFTFGGGPRACIGLKFAVTEMKALLFTLVKAFEFELAVPLSEFDNSLGNIKKPALKSDPFLKAQLPMFIRRAPTESVPLN